jgi:glyoxylate reductase
MHQSGFQILVTKRVFDEGLEPLREAGAQLDYHESDLSLSSKELCERARGKHALVTQLSDPISEDVIAAGGGTLRVIAQVAVGYDNIAVEAATRRGILVTHTPDVLTETTADLAWALLLATARRVVESDAFLRAGKFQRWTMDLFCGQDVYGKTLGLVGMGRIGRAVARRAKGFGMRVLYESRTRLPGETERELGAEYATRERLFAESDFVSLHVPLTPQTRHIVGREQLEAMKPEAILVNTARGPVVDEKALVEALESGAIRGAGLDVYEREPEVEPGLVELPNVVLLPHIGSASWETRRAMCGIAARDALAGLRGERPRFALNPEVLELR